MKDRQHHLSGVRRIPLAAGLAASAVVAAGVALPSAAANAAGVSTYAYVVDLAGSSVHIVDAATGSTTATVPVGLNPYSVVLSADGRRAYTVDNGADTVSVIDTTRRVVVATIQLPGATGTGAYEATLSPDGATLYVVDADNDRLDAIDTATRTVTRTVPVPDWPGSVVATSTKVYVGVDRGEVAVYDASTLALDTTIPVQGRVQGLTLVPRTNLVYVAHTGDDLTTGGASVIDTTTDTVTTTGAPFYGGYQAASSLDGTRAYVTGAGGLEVYDTSGAAPVARVSVGVSGASASDVAVAPDGRIFLATDNPDGPSDELDVVDPSTLTVVKTIPLPGQVVAVAVGPIAPAPTGVAHVQAKLSGTSVGRTNTSYSYTVTARDAGPGAASGVSAGLLLPPHTTLVSASGTYVQRGQLVLWKAVPTLGVNASTTYQATVRFTTKGAQTLLGLAWSNTTDPSPFDNAARLRVQIS